MKKLILIVVVLLFVLPFESFGQSPYDNHKKYWYYRYRLKNHFMKIGKAPGESLIASERAGYNSKKDLTFGDQTVNLGMYICILAMEYHHLANNNQSTEETINELFHALYAFNRLDENAESFFRNPRNPTINPLPGDLNGFFVKDDATDDFFLQNQNHFNNKNIKSKYLVSSLSSQWESSSKNNNSGVEESQDQYYYILMGMYFVRKFIPRHITYKSDVFQDGERSINLEAANIAMRITSHLNWTGFTSIPTNVPSGNASHWTLINPVTNKPVLFSQFPYLWSHASGQISNSITFPDFARVIGVPNSGFPAQHTQFSSTQGTGAKLWQTTKNGFATQDQAHMCGLLNALMNRSNANPFYAGLISSWDVQHVPLIKQVIHGGNNPYFSKKSYEKRLDEAPCSGPFVFDWKSGDVALSPQGGLSYEWSTSDRITHPERRGGNSSQFIGEFPGIDYMFYHNLYYTVVSSSYSNPINQMNLDIRNPMPNFFTGTISNPYQFDAFEKIEASNIIGSWRNGDITYRAGEEILLKPGFNVIKGSKFHAYLKRYECSSSGSGGYSIIAKGDNEKVNSKQVIKPHDIKQDVVDYDFRFDESENIEGIEKISSIKNVVVTYPNPTKDNITLKISLEITEELKLEIFDVTGYRIKEIRNLPHNCKIDLSGYSAGVYIFKISSDNLEVNLEEKVIKI